MLPQECLYLNQKVTSHGRKGVFAIVLCLKSLTGHEDTILHNAIEKIASVYMIGSAEQQKVLRILNTIIYQTQGI